RCPKVDAELQRMPAQRLGNVIDPLELLRNLLLRQEVRRTDEREVRERDLRDSTRDCRIFRHARNKFVHLILAERVLLGCREVANKAYPEFVHHSRSKRMRPSDDRTLCLKRLSAPS